MTTKLLKTAMIIGALSVPGIRALADEDASTSPSVRQQSPTGADSKSMTKTTKTHNRGKRTASTSAELRNKSPTGADSKSMTEGTGTSAAGKDASTDPSLRQQSPTGADSKSMTESTKDE